MFFLVIFNVVLQFFVVENLVMFEFTGCFYWLSTFVAHTKAFSTLNAQETLIRNNCTLCGKLFKTTNLQNHKRNHTKSQFSNKRSDPLHLIFWQSFWLEWFLMGQRTVCLVTKAMLIPKCRLDQLLHAPILILIPCHFWNCFFFPSSPTISRVGKIGSNPAILTL